MSSVSKAIADDIIAGRFSGDQTVKIVRYQSPLADADRYGVVAAGDDPDKYRASEFVRNPTTYWERK